MSILINVTPKATAKIMSGRLTLLAVTLSMARAFAGISQPATYVAQDGTNYIFYRDINSHIQALYLPQNHWTGAQWLHGDLTVATGAPRAAGSPTGYVAPEGTDYVRSEAGRG